ncbi:MAG: prephenate dehydrogenase [Solirubrobacteraceae bacterium]|nr:prephenate dehydrogenase [Solirubrobacteraceae bacterium]
MRVAVVGVGLIGGSIGMAARERLGARVSGFDPDPAVLEAALAHGAIDEAADSPPEAVGGADLVFVAAPVGVLTAAIEEVLRHAESDCGVTDVGSTKRRIVAGASDQRFIGGHPLAGAETSGVEHARADLFDGAIWYLTPHARTSGVLYERLHRAIAGLGAQPTAIDAEIHDRVMATVSHLPHVLANVLVAQAARALVDPASPDQAERVPATGPSFRDATRVAGANEAIWPDIYLSNRDALLSAVEDTISRLEHVRRALTEADRGAIVAWNAAARADRDALLGAGLAGGMVHELRVAVPNRPGVLAEIALTLGREGVNIVDMALSPSAADGQGVVALWFRGQEQADRAIELIGALSMPVVRA